MSWRSSAVAFLLGSLAIFTLPAHGGMFLADGRDVLRTDTGEPEGDDSLCSSYIAPVDIGWISSEFGDVRRASGQKLVHKGIDYAAAVGTPVAAAASGEIARIDRSPTYGRYVVIQHPDGLATLYAHLSRIERSLKVGANLEQGSVVGFVGKTGRARGSNLHFELRVDELPIDPAKLLNVNAETVSASGLRRQEDCRSQDMEASN